MSLKNYIEKIRFIDHLIQRKMTGNQKLLARKTNLSLSSINNYINEMRDAGFPIRYCRKRKTYYYEREGHMVTSLFNEFISESPSLISEQDIN